MVQISNLQPTKNNQFKSSGFESVLDVWLNKVANLNPSLNIDEIKETSIWLRVQINNTSCDWDQDLSCFTVSLELAETVASLKLDQNAVIASLLYRAVREQKLTLAQINAHFGAKVSHLIESILKLANLNQAPSTNLNLAGKNQLDILRKMLVALVDDVRVVIIKIAERTCAMRLAKNTPFMRQLAISHMVADIYAPLAHRLGMGHIKWELEDLSFRYLHPEQYKQIAKLLQEKRLEREQFIAQTINQLEHELEQANIKVQISGRVKHIYSIWRKMQIKDLSFNQLYDIRALRVLVDSEQDCYATLGVVHRIWQHIPHEFDDYIASPKANGYRSLHTAVVGPNAKVLEVQIRTHQMHEEAELGFCSHWQYKGTDSKNTDASYANKIDQLRQNFEDYIANKDAVDLDQSSIASEPSNIYVFTPDGHVIELTKGSTALDFAYRIHTEIGHSCRGAKINGRIVPLNTRLKTGDQIQVITGNKASPSRDWLNSNLGYLVSSKAKSKIANWFRNLDRSQNIIDGKSSLEREFKQLAISGIDLLAVAKKLDFTSLDDMYASLGAGILKVNKILSKIEPKDKQFVFTEIAPTKKPPQSNNITIAGVGNLLTNIASCCQPVLGEPIIGYITAGRGVSIHRQDCLEVLQLATNQPSRMIEVSWGDKNSKQTYPVDIIVEAYDRIGLLRDITQVIASENINLLSMHNKVNKDDNTSVTSLTVEIANIPVLRHLLTKINQLPNIIDARRKN